MERPLSPAGACGTALVYRGEEVNMRSISSPGARNPLAPAAISPCLPLPTELPFIHELHCTSRRKERKTGEKTSKTSVFLLFDLWGMLKKSLRPPSARLGW